MNTMIWRRLKNNKCPICNRVLVESKDKNIFCLKKHFLVTYEQFEEIVNHLYRKKGFLIEWREFCKTDINLIKK